MISVEVRCLAWEKPLKIQTPCRIVVDDTIMVGTILHSVIKTSPLMFVNNGACQEVMVEELF